MCDKCVSKEPFILKHCLGKYKTPEMHDKAFSSYLITLKFCIFSWGYIFF